MYFKTKVMFKFSISQRLYVEMRPKMEAKKIITNRKFSILQLPTRSTVQPVLRYHKS